MALAGRGGSVKFSSSTAGTPALVADLREWTLNVEAEMFEVSTFGSSAWRRFQPNLTGAQGTLSGYWNVMGSTTMRAIQQQVLGLSTDASNLRLLVDNASANGYSGEAWVTGVQPGASVDAIVPFAANFTFNGPVAYSTTL